MAVEYTLLMQKEKSGSAVKSSLADFGFAVCAIPWPDEETKEPATRDWPGEHGEDVYIPQEGLKLQAYDIEVEFCYKGDVGTAYDAYKNLRGYLIGEGGFMSFYDPYWCRGGRKIYVRKFGDLEPHRSNIDEALSAKVTFRVTDPVGDMILEYVGD